jgi:hypothetical protein
VGALKFSGVGMADVVVVLLVVVLAFDWDWLSSATPPQSFESICPPSPHAKIATKPATVSMVIKVRCMALLLTA